jgi:hypothetical protein
MTNSQLKTYIKANRNNESACHEAIKLLMSRQSQNNFKYSYDIPEQEMKALFTEKLREKSV